MSEKKPKNSTRNKASFLVIRVVTRNEMKDVK